MLDSVESFMRQYLEQNERVELHPGILQDQLAVGRVLFSPASSKSDKGRGLPWEDGELSGTEQHFVELIAPTPSDTSGAEAPFSAFLLHMNNNKNLLYAGDPNVNIEYLTALDIPVDYLLVNEWNLRRGVVRRALASRFSDRQLIILPANRPMNNQQRKAVRQFFPNAQLLSVDDSRIMLK